MLRSSASFALLTSVNDDKLLLHELHAEGIGLSLYKTQGHPELVSGSLWGLVVWSNLSAPFLTHLHKRRQESGSRAYAARWPFWN